MPNDLTFKDIVSQFAQDNQILFIPTQKKYLSKTIYSFGISSFALPFIQLLVIHLTGPLSVYLDKEFLYCLRDGAWTATALDTLLNLVKKKTSK